MHTFYSTCPSGCEMIAQRMLRSARVLKVLPGALIYTASVERPACEAFQNSYRLLAEYPKCDSMERAARLAARDISALREADMLMRRLRFRTFRVMFSDGNALAAPPKAERSAMEKGIRAATVDRVSPDTELLVLRRTEGFAMLLLRLTKRAAVPKGELSPMVAACLAFESGLTKGATFLDPFAGSGAVGAAALKTAGKVFLSDADGVAVSAMQNRFSGKCAIVRADARHLSHIPDGSIDAIATDPPWGLFREADVPLSELYDGMLPEFRRVLKKGARIAVLTADKQGFETALAAHGFRLLRRTDVLINGKKAAIFAAEDAL